MCGRSCLCRMGLCEFLFPRLIDIGIEEADDRGLL